MERRLIFLPILNQQMAAIGFGSAGKAIDKITEEDEKFLQHTKKLS